MEGDQVFEKNADMSTLTQRYTDRAISFIKQHKNNPFFFYLPHTMPHTELAVSDRFKGSSGIGLYADVIQEIDWNVGRILDTVKDLGLDSQTYIIFTSDNGPWWIKKEHGGSSGPLRGAKTSTWEGGLRVPCVMRAPGKIPAGTVCDEITCTMDMLPTLARLAGTAIPTDRIIDGLDITNLIHGTSRSLNPTRPFYYYQHTHLQAVRMNKWKLHLPRPANPPWSPNWTKHIDPKDVIDIKEPLLFDLENDVGEQNNVASAHPDTVQQLLQLAEKARQDIGDYNRIGKNARFYDPQPPRPDIHKWQNLGNSG
jgi:arylsulfatase